MVHSFGSNRGQLSIAILLAGVVVVFAIFLWSVRPDVRVVPSVDTLPEAQAFVDDCLRLSLEENLVRASLQGGYVFLDGPAIETPLGLAGVFSNGSLILAPSLNSTEADLDDAVGQSVNRCLTTKETPPGLSIAIVGDASVRVRLGDSQTQATLTGSIRASRGTQSATITSASAEVPVRYRRLHELATQSARRIGESYGNFEITYFDKLPVPSDITPFSKGIVAITFIDNQSRISGRAYLFSVYASTPDEDEPSWSIPRTLTTRISGGDKFTIITNPEGWTLASDNPLFKVDANTAQSIPWPAGTYNVTLEATSRSLTQHSRVVEVLVR